jgi:hypothetical protein
MIPARPVLHNATIASATDAVPTSSDDEVQDVPRDTVGSIGSAARDFATGAGAPGTVPRLYQQLRNERLYRFIPQDPPASPQALEDRYEGYRVGVVAAEIDTRNVASIALVESLGFSRVAFEKGADHFKGSSSDEYRYELSEGVWREERAGSGG